MSDTPRMRLAVVGVVVVGLFAALLSRLWYLQVLDADTFVEAASANQVRILYEEAPRGRILDRNGDVVVDNRVSPTVTVDREQIAEHPDVKPRLSALLGITPEELDKRLADQRFSRYLPIPVAQDVPEETVVYLEEHAEDFPGVRAELVAQRAYPNGPLAAHLLGYVGEINDKELEARKAAGYRLGDSIGKSGVELVFEEDLRGEPGITKLQVDALGRVVGPPLGQKAPVQGSDVHLTLDIGVQRVAEQALVQGLEAARQRADRESRKPFVAPAGSLVVLDPRDGSVVAMASFPSYDPASFVNGIRPEVFAQLNDPANHYPLNNRAITGQYAPGSTFKLITAIAGVQRGLVTPGTTIVDGGVYRVPGCRGDSCYFQNAGRRAYGKVSLRRAMTVSSDVYFYSLGARFWIERKGERGIQETAQQFGLGHKTGIGLPTDKAGLIPDPDLKRQRHEQNPTAFPEGRWFAGDNVNISIGQGDVLVTPLQLANVYATFANGGTRWQPRLAAKVTSQDGTVQRTLEPVPAGRVDLSPELRRVLLDGLRGVIDDEEGTATYAFRGFPLRDFPVAGKTGTAQVTGKQDSAVFAAFAPADDPRYAVAVVLEEAGFGGSTAAPVARKILEAIATADFDLADNAPVAAVEGGD